MAIDAGSIYSAIRIELDKLTADIKKVDALYDQLGTSLGASSKKSEKTITDSLQKINLAHIALFAAIGAYVKKSITDYAAFEQALANVQSVSKASAEDMKLLEQAAKEAGETTKFSGKQAADAMYYLASAGFTAKQSMEALDGVLALASATQADLAFTSETVASAISQFGLQASDSLRVANVFAAGIAASQATIDKLAVSMRYVGPVAAAFGYQIEEVTGTLSILYNAGFEASQAGTALRSVLADLSNAASPAIEKLKALGISFKDVDPAANSLIDVFKALNPIAQNGGKIMEIFGDRAGPAMIKLLQSGAAEIEAYTQKVTGTNSAIEAAAIQNETLQFALARLGKAFGAIGKSIADEFAPGLKEGANWLASLLFSISKMPGPLKIFLGILAWGTVVVTGLSAAIGLLGGVLGGFALPVIGIVAGVAALTAGIVALTTKSNALQTTTGNLSDVTKTLKKSVDDYKTANEQLNKNTETLNETEKKTLKARKELAGLDISANLQKTVKEIDKLNKEQQKQNEQIEDYQVKARGAQNMVDLYTKKVKDLADAQKAGITYSLDENKNLTLTTDLLKDAEKGLKAYTKDLQNKTAELEKSKKILQESNQQEKETLDFLAQSLALGLIDFKQLQLYNEELANSLVIRAQKLKTEEKENEVKKKNVETTKQAIELTAEEIDSNKELQKIIEKTKTQYEDLNATEIQRLENERRRINDEIKLSKASQTLKDEAIKANDQLYDALIQKKQVEIEEEQRLKILNDTVARNDQLIKNNTETIDRYNNSVRKKQEQKLFDQEAINKAEEYRQKLLAINSTNNDAIEIEKQKALEEADASLAGIDAKEKLLLSIEEYYAKLKEKEAIDEFNANMKNMINTVINGFVELMGSVSEISRLQAQAEIDVINAENEAQKRAIDDRLNAQLAAQGFLEATEKQRLEREIAEAKAAGDIITENEKIKELNRLKLIEQSNNEKKKLDEKAAKETAKIKYKSDLAAWEADNWAIAGKALLAEMQAWASAPWPWNLVSVGITTAAVAALVHKQSLTKPKPPAFQTGGIILGSQQGTIVRAAENGTDELLLNNSQAGIAMLNRVADAIINRMQSQESGVPANIYINLEGNPIAEFTVRMINDGKYPIKQRAIL